MTEEIKEILDIEKYRNKDGYVENINLLPDEIHKLLDYITNLQQENEKLKEEHELVRCDLHNTQSLLEGCKEDLDKANDIIEKDRQFYKCRMDEYAELKKENERLEHENLCLREYHVIDKKAIPNELTKEKNFMEILDMPTYEDYKSRCEGTINLIDRTIEIIKQQPTKDDSWILSRLYGFKYALNGCEEE